MTALDGTLDALTKLKAHERAIGNLYGTFADRFPEQEEFWSKLSREEDRHAKWIDMLRARMQDDPMSLVTDRFPTAAIEHSVAFIEKLTAKAGTPEFTSINAISAALNLEQGLLENKYFESFQTDKAEMKRVLTLLRDKTQSHYLMVQQAWQNARQPAAEELKDCGPNGTAVLSRPGRRELHTG